MIMKPHNYLREGDRIWNIRRSTAEALAAEGFLTLGLGAKMTTRHTLTDKGRALFDLAPGKRFKWEEEKAEPRRSTTGDFFAASMDPASPFYAPFGTYPDECGA